MLGLKKVFFSRLEQVDLTAKQVTFHSYLNIRRGSRQVVWQLNLIIKY